MIERVQMLQPIDEDAAPLRRLLDDIEEFCVRKGMSPTKFGRLALGDPHFVSRLRDGRDILVKRGEAARRFMRTYKGES